MEEEAVVPGDPLAIDAAAIVSETDAAHSSGEEEGGWLARRHQRRRLTHTGTGGTAAQSSHGEEDDSDNELEMKESAGPEDLYCGNMDDEDEAWVYQHMRSGMEELVRVRQHQQDQSDATEKSDSTLRSNNCDGADSKENNTRGSGQQDEAKSQNPQLKQALLLKPRASDAILSCPRCFNIVCMDCQQHERYANQYRAMFVMNIGVDWNKRMIYDDAIAGLKSDPDTHAAGSGRHNASLMPNRGADGATLPDTVPHDAVDNKPEENKELYFSVHCCYCQWELAALDMKDEIYYFFGCIASA
ncbi:hypothetical protein ACHAWF_004926 [Thalassiosira exigua]